MTAPRAPTKPVAKPKYRFCWHCSKQLYAGGGGKLHRTMLIPGVDCRLGETVKVHVHASCVKGVKADYPEAEEELSDAGQA